MSDTSDNGDDLPQKRSWFDTTVERVHYLIDTLEMTQVDSRQSLARDYILKYLPPERQQESYERICNDPHQFIEDEIRGIFQEMDITKRTAFLKAFLLGTLNKHTVSDLMTLLEMGCFDANVDVHGGSLVASISDHAPVMLPYSRRPWESLDPQPDEEEKRYILRCVYQILFAYGANPNSTYGSAGSGDMKHALTCFDLVILNEVGKKDPKNYELTNILQWMCKGGLEMGPSVSDGLSKIQQLTAILEPSECLRTNNPRTFNVTKLRELYTVLLTYHADMSEPFPGEKPVDGPESLGYLLSKDGKTIIELVSDYEKAMERAIQEPEKFAAFLKQAHINENGWEQDFTTDLETLEQSRRFYRDMGRTLKELYKEHSGIGGRDGVSEPSRG